MSIELKKVYKNHEKVIQNTLFILCLPFFLILANMVCSAIFNLGTYVGTFLRCLYELVVF